MKPHPKVKAIRYKSPLSLLFVRHIRQLDKWKCVNPDCRRFVLKIHTQVHHVKSRGAGGSDVEENCFTLCMHCHGDCHKANLQLDWAKIHAARPKHISFAECHLTVVQQRKRGMI